MSFLSKTTHRCYFSLADPERKSRWLQVGEVQGNEFISCLALIFFFSVKGDVTVSFSPRHDIYDIHM